MILCQRVHHIHSGRFKDIFVLRLPGSPCVDKAPPGDEESLWALDHPLGTVVP